MNQPAYFDNDDHALLAGMFLGFLLSKGVSVRPALDEESNYMNEMIVTMDSAGIKREVRVAVLPPED